MAEREALILYVQSASQPRIPSYPFPSKNDRQGATILPCRARKRSYATGVSGPVAASGSTRVAGGEESGSTSSPDADFKAQLIALIPQLRAFARSIYMGPNSDDLAQDAMLRGWKSRARFERGTNLKAWLFTILRNQFLTDKRRSWRSLPLDPWIAEQTLVAHDDPSSREELLDVRAAMRLLPDDQRQALVLIGSAGMSYDEAAEICGCPVGTVKSRVSRARATLVRILGERETGSRVRVDVPATEVFQIMMDEASVLRSQMATDSRRP